MKNTSPHFDWSEFIIHIILPTILALVLIVLSFTMTGCDTPPSQQARLDALNAEEAQLNTAYQDSIRHWTTDIRTYKVPTTYYMKNITNKMIYTQDYKYNCFAIGDTMTFEIITTYIDYTDSIKNVSDSYFMTEYKAGDMDTTYTTELSGNQKMMIDRNIYVINYKEINK